MLAPLRGVRGFAKVEGKPEVVELGRSTVGEIVERFLAVWWRVVEGGAPDSDAVVADSRPAVGK